jgi:hypothetical protein
MRVRHATNGPVPTCLSLLRLRLYFFGVFMRARRGVAGEIGEGVRVIDAPYEWTGTFIYHCQWYWNRLHTVWTLDRDYTVSAV